MKLIISATTAKIKEELAYAIIAEFFNTYSLSLSLAYLRKVLRAANSHQHWQGNGANVLFFYERLQALVIAALTIHYGGGRREAAIIPLAKGQAPDIGKHEDYCGWHRLRAPWYFVPRHLSRKEYSNPYLVFKKLAGKGSKKQWKWRLQELCHYTLGTSQIGGWNEDLDSLQLYLLLAKVLEAAHLIEVRAIIEIAGELVPKWTNPLSSNEAS